MANSATSEETSGLTHEDRMIFRARTTVAAQARLIKADRRDAFQIRNRVNRARYGGVTVASDVATWDRMFGALYS
jgi:hypothetical protein